MFSNIRIKNTFKNKDFAVTSAFCLCWAPTHFVLIESAVTKTKQFHWQGPMKVNNRSQHLPKLKKRDKL